MLPQPIRQRQVIVSMYMLPSPEAFFIFKSDISLKASLTLSGQVGLYLMQSYNKIRYIIIINTLQ